MRAHSLPRYDDASSVPVLADSGFLSCQYYRRMGSCTIVESPRRLAGDKFDWGSLISRPSPHAGSEAEDLNQWAQAYFSSLGSREDHGQMAYVGVAPAPDGLGVFPMRLDLSR